MKTGRQQKIRELIKDKIIDTQEELLRLLRECGYDVTQATVSRDIKELRLVKALDSAGRYRYINNQNDTSDITSRFYSLINDSVVSCDIGQNIVCIKCYSGMAQAVCTSLDSAQDSLQLDGIIGTLAGEDTIFVLCRNEERAAALVDRLNELLRR